MSVIVCKCLPTLDVLRINEGLRASPPRTGRASSHSTRIPKPLRHSYPTPRHKIEMNTRRSMPVQMP